MSASKLDTVLLPALAAELQSCLRITCSRNHVSRAVNNYHSFALSPCHALWCLIDALCGCIPASMAPGVRREYANQQQAIRPGREVSATSLYAMQEVNSNEEDSSAVHHQLEALKT